MTVMAIQLSTLATLWDDGQFVLTRAASEGETVLLASPSKEPSAATLAQLERWLALRDELDATWAVRPSRAR